MTLRNRSILIALAIAVGIHAYTLGLLREILPREASPPLVQTTRSLRFDSGKFLRLAHTDGSVEVITHDGSDFIITAEVRAYGRDKLREVAEAYIETMVTGLADGGGIRVQTESGDRPEPLDLRTDYKLTVPRGTNLSVEGANGNVLIREGCGALFISGNNTDIKIINPGAAVRAESNNGRIKVENAPGETVLKTINGNIHARMAGGHLKAETTNGSVSASLGSPAITACDLKSLNGGITLSVVEGCTLAVEAETDSGSVSTDLPLDYAKGYPKRRKLIGSEGGGQTRATLYSRNGDISITRKKP